MVHAVVTGGGTSGHVVPAIAILEALEDAGHDRSVLRYVGSCRGIESSLMADTGIESVYLPISGLQRSFSPRSVARNLALPFRLVWCRIVARRLVRRWCPSVVVSVGGYASEPMAAAALAAGVPLVCVAYDRTPGLATRRQSRRATACAVAFPGVDLPRASVVGAPVRRELRHLDVDAQRARARRMLGCSDDEFVLAVVGGSLGSGVLNAAVPAVLDALVGHGKVRVRHVCGERNLADPMPTVPDGVAYERVGYEPRMAALYAACDLIVARAGASTVAEIATVGVASVLVPWAGAAGNHQELNARWLGDEGAAFVVPESGCTDGTLVRTIVRLVDDADARRALARSARLMGELNRGNAITDLIENAAG